MCLFEFQDNAEKLLKINMKALARTTTTSFVLITTIALRRYAREPAFQESFLSSAEHTRVFFCKYCGTLTM